jgi:hypothetical protein
MNRFRIYLVLVLLTLGGYTLAVGSRHGWNLLPLFFGDIAALTWAGQFNMDFLSFLLLSGLWVAWRHHFSAAGLALGLVAVFGGMLFLATYLLVAMAHARGNIQQLLLGRQRNLQGDTR